MNLSTRRLRRVIDRFGDRGNIRLLSSCGCILSFDDCDFTLREEAVWNKRSHIIAYTFVGHKWMLHLLDSPNNGKRLLQIVSHSGDETEIEKAIKGFVF